MKDLFEKRIDRHYTYVYKKERSFTFNDNTGWYISRQEHEPNEKPTFENSFCEIAFGLSEGSAKAEVIELQLAEMKRRKQIAIQQFSYI